MPPTTTASDNRPPFTLPNFFKDIHNGIIGLIINPQATRVTYPLIICIASIVTKIIINKVPYTEIDYTTYLQQIDKVNAGELDYANIYGDSGPIVYPAGFITVYQYIQWLCGDNVKEAQYIFGYCFTATLALACFVYAQIWDLQPWPIYLFLASKRLLSIYVLRLFNDCWTTICMVGVVLLLQQAAVFKEAYKGKKVDFVDEDEKGRVKAEGKKGKRDVSKDEKVAVREVITGSSWFDISFLLTIIAADLYSIAISIKMNALLYAPAFLLIIYFLNDENLLKFIIFVAVVPLAQVMIGWRFLLLMFDDDLAKTIRWNYISNAFNFGRRFLYKWTVNWKFVPESIFTSIQFGRALLVLHLTLLLFFTFTRFLNHKIIGKSIPQLIKDSINPSPTISPSNIFLNPLVAPQIIFYIMTITNLIGVLCSRSLHYQFLAWYAWTLPGLLHLNFPVYVGVPLWLVHEWCWNVFPATASSSAVLVSLLTIILVFNWYNFEAWFPKQSTLKEYDEFVMLQKQEEKQLSNKKTE
ncbi:ALG3 [Candida theae]|uniref:Dol-P-Man:Man(5)GlcNAc(2)-PP-Dol alpha-1,3-mannosyltransferase n=1 Tax=Candida theae TaxID=1198502 RepID=A0AAD5BIH3_9ASCO|nr:ALG3 [Candida theae]KAI5966018.1 ALG3 [Candida theae]